ncbi:3-oxoacyl-ACP synthase III family protein [Streptomyces olivoreticuli]
MASCSRARLTGLAVHLPDDYRTMARARERIAAAGSPFVPSLRVLEDFTGIRGVHVKAEHVQASDLAVAAAHQALSEAETDIGEVDLLLFAACSQDMLEPATAHVVAAKLGARCAVLDIKNACNSVLNALDVAAAFIESGRCRTVLITCGEAPTLTARWYVPDQETFLRSMPGYTVSDAGAALLLTAGPAGRNDPGVLVTRFGADSTAWDACTVAAGGTLHPRPADDEPTYVQLNGDLLRDAVLAALPLIRQHAAEELAMAKDSTFTAFHQVSLSHFHEVCSGLSIPADRCMPTVVEHGNTASASLPLQLVRARDSGLVQPGDQVTLIGMASGVSFGLAHLRL